MASDQKKIFMEDEGNGWFSRNRIVDEKLTAKAQIDPVLQMIEERRLAPLNVLEIGASNGWRLSVLKERNPDIQCAGIEPSAQAVAEAFPGIDMHQGTAEALPFEESSFDLIVFGFCLYLCDRRDLFKIAAEADRVLMDGGYLIVYDFYAESPYKNPYAHVEGLFSYKMDYSRMFSWNPSYSTIHQMIAPHPGTTDTSPDNLVEITLMRKGLSEGWPDRIQEK
ncbi:MAG: class I SAM-dependent methyltransferase [Rhodospirillales bacterium]|nr:class I SAM-dependent methyltransferase [Rhodospirillales bacterium]